MVFGNDDTASDTQDSMDMQIFGTREDDEEMDDDTGDSAELRKMKKQMVWAASYPRQHLNHNTVLEADAVIKIIINSINFKNTSYYYYRS